MPSFVGAVEAFPAYVRPMRAPKPFVSESFVAFPYGPCMVMADDAFESSQYSVVFQVYTFNPETLVSQPKNGNSKPKTLNHKLEGH